MLRVLRWWRKTIVIVWFVVLIHFLKDITQDILHIPTFLDVFGDIHENVSWLPSRMQGLIYSAGVGSFIAEILLLIALPIVRKNKEISSLEKWTIGVVIFMLIYFPVVILLDPRFGGNRS